MTDVAMAETRASRDRLEMVIRRVGLGIAFVDESDRITLANRELERITGSTEPLLRRRFRSVMSRFFAPGSPTPESEITTVDGTVYELSTFVVPAEEGGGRFYTVRDVTERRQVARKTEEFVSVVSHELRTPLTSMRGAISLLAAVGPMMAREQRKKMIDVASRNVDRLDTLISEVLDMQACDLGRVELSRRDLDLVPILEEAIRRTTPAAEARSIVFELDAPETVPIVADAERIIQVTCNLLRNAVKFGPANAPVQIEVSHDAERARVTVCDEGPGVPEDARERIFEPFVQLDSSDTRANEGLGLGLPIARRLVELHSGSLWLDDTRSKGAAFSFDLPVSPS
jgi:signal transduction histidine kinase